MTEQKFKKLIVALTVGAVLLLFILISIMVYQLVSIKVKNDRLDELNAEIASYEQMIKNGEDTLEVRSKRWWIELRARELGYIYDGEDLLN